MTSRVLHVKYMLSLLVCIMFVGELSWTSKWRLKKKRRKEVVAAALEPPPEKRKPLEPLNCQKCHQRLSSKCKVCICFLLHIECRFRGDRAHKLLWIMVLPTCIQ